MSTRDRWHPRPGVAGAEVAGGGSRHGRGVRALLDEHGACIFGDLEREGPRRPRDAGLVWVVRVRHRVARRAEINLGYGGRSRVETSSW